MGMTWISVKIYWWNAPLPILYMVAPLLHVYYRWSIRRSVRAIEALYDNVSRETNGGE